MSYCAGDTKNTKPILVNGIICNVFANLNHALGEVRRFWKENYEGLDKEMLLWTDQICINQVDLGERLHQVGFMRDIYEQAEQVLVCLSTNETQSTGLKWLSGLSEVPEGLDLYATSSQQPLFKRVQDMNFAEGWLAFFDLIDSHWWSRGWVCQEFIVASTIQLLNNGQHSPLEKLEGLLRELCEFRKALRGHSDVLWTFLDVSLSRSPDSVEKDDLIRFTDRNGLEKTDAAMQLVGLMISSRMKWSGTLNLRELLTHVRHYKTSEPRDKIYAFLGLIRAKSQVIPDYMKTYDEVCIEVTRMVINHDQNLKVLFEALDGVRPSGCTLPSWAVSLTSFRERGTRFSRHRLAYASSACISVPLGSNAKPMI